MKKKLILFTALLLLINTLYSQEPEKVSAPDTSVTDVLKLQHTEPLPISSMVLDDDDGGDQDMSGLLQSSRDVYTSMAGFNFGQARFRFRGYDSRHTSVVINGVQVNDLEQGRPIWSYWGGLNDITRWHETGTGLTSCPVAFSTIGGYSNININAASQRKGTRFSYAASNRSYSNRIMLTTSTGMMDNGWAFSFSGSRRWAQEGYVEGTFYDAWSYYLAAEKKINNAHSISLTAFAAPTKTGRAGLATQEAFDLTGNNHYNPYWGYQNGEKRNARVSSHHRPLIMLSHLFKIDEKSNLKNTIFYTFGKNSMTMLNWYDANNPNPDYYRYLPSYWKDNEVLFDYYTDLWQNEPSSRQIDWDHFYFANNKNLYTVQNANGINGNHVTGNRSKYIVEELRTDLSHMGFTSNFNRNINDHFKLNAGLSISRFKSFNYKILNDLLGGDFWVDVDQFAERDFDDPLLAQNDLENPNRIIKEGDVFGYDYVANINKNEGFLQGIFNFGKIEGYAAANLSQTSYWRTGNMRNGKFYDNSFGDSEKQNFINYGAKLGLAYKITGRHIVTANGAYLTLAPTFRNSYVSPRTRDNIPNNLTNEEVKSADINYLIRYPNLNVRLTAYYTEINNQIWLRSFYHDVYRTFINYQMTNVDHLHTGVELGLSYNITSSLIFTGAFTKGENIWNSRPNASIIRDNSAEPLDLNRTIYLKNYKIGGMPQTAASGGLRYNGKKFWFAGFNVNYFADIYFDVNPDRRTAEAVSKYVVSDPQWEQITKQTKLDNNYTADVFFGKSWRLKGKDQNYFINLNVNINNILNNSFIIGGFEQLRYDSSNIDKFPHKYSYLYGRTYFAMLSLRF